jgi:hypothetical protein
VGPQGDVGPQPVDGSPPANLTVIENSGQLVEKEYGLDAFDEIEINGLEVKIRQGDSYGVTVNVEKNLFDYITVGQEGSKLKIGLDPTKTYHMVNVTQDAEITIPRLTALVILTGSAEEVTLEAQGPCEIDLSELSVKNLKVNADDLCQITHQTND